MQTATAPATYAPSPARFAPAPSRVVSARVVDDEPILARPGRRLMARITDQAITYGVPTMLGAATAFAVPRIENQTAMIAVLATGVVLALGWWALITAVNLVLLHLHGQTLGKKATGLRIERNDGSKAGLMRAWVLRSLVPLGVKLIPGLGALFAGGDVLCIFTEGHRTLHDRMADTRVVVVLPS